MLSIADVTASSHSDDQTDGSARSGARWRGPQAASEEAREPQSTAGGRRVLLEQCIPTPLGDPSLRAHMRSHCVQDDKRFTIMRNRVSHALKIHCGIEVPRFFIRPL